MLCVCSGTCEVQRHSFVYRSNDCPIDIRATPRLGNSVLLVKSTTSCHPQGSNEGNCEDSKTIIYQSNDYRVDTQPCATLRLGTLVLLVRVWITSCHPQGSNKDNWEDYVNCSALRSVL